jgi:hypothetical protein
MCGEPFTPDTVIAIAYSQDGAEVGLMCDQCAHAGRQVLRRRIALQASSLRRHAEALERLAAEDIAFPTHAEWAALEASQNPANEDYLSGLWYESLNQMVAV